MIVIQRIPNFFFIISFLQVFAIGAAKHAELILEEEFSEADIPPAIASLSADIALLLPSGPRVRLIHAVVVARPC